MSYDRSAMDANSVWTVVGVALLLAGLLLGAIAWHGGGRTLGAVLLLAGVLGGPVVIALFGV